MYLVAALSMAAALIHVWVTPEHFEEWCGYGTFFLVAAVAQGYGVALLLRPRRSLLLLGLGGNLSVVALYLVTRTVGVPLRASRGKGRVGGSNGLARDGVRLAIVLGVVLLRVLSPQMRRTVLIVVPVSVLSITHLLLR